MNILLYWPRQIQLQFHLHEQTRLNDRLDYEGNSALQFVIGKNVYHLPISKVWNTKDTSSSVVKLPWRLGYRIISATPSVATAKDDAPFKRRGWVNDQGNQTSNDGTKQHRSKRHHKLSLEPIMAAAGTDSHETSMSKRNWPETNDKVKSYCKNNIDNDLF